jgi:hypothetical protein
MMVMVKIMIVTVFSKFQVDISCSFKVMDPVHILLTQNLNKKINSDRVTGLFDNDVVTDGECIFQVSK